MENGLFVKIVILIIINAFVRQFVSCMHDKFCAACKTGAAGK